MPRWTDMAHWTDLSVIVCTSETRPSLPDIGMTIYETDTDEVLVYDGVTWRRSE